MEMIKVLIARGERHGTHLNMDQSDGFEHPSRRCLGREGGREGCRVRRITHCVLCFHAALSCLKPS